MEQLLAQLGRQWYLLVALAGVAALLLLNGAAYVHVMRPRSGTLEWISRYDRPACTLLDGWTGLTTGDIAPLLSVTLGAAAVWGAAALVTIRSLYGSPIPGDVLAETVVTHMVFPALTALAVYRLLRGLFGSRLGALLGTWILTLSMAVQPSPMLVAAVAVLLLTRYLTAPAQSEFGEYSLYLILAFAMAAVGCYLRPGLAGVALMMVVLLCCGAADRFVHAGRGRLVRSLLAGLLSLAVVWILAYVPGGVTQGLPFPQLLVLRDFYEYAFYRMGWELLEGLGSGVPPIVQFYFDWPLIICGAAAFVVCLVGGFRRPKASALLAAGWMAALTALWLLAGFYLVPLGCVLCLSSLWADLSRRGQPWLAVVAGGSILLVQLTLYGFYWLT